MKITGRSSARVLAPEGTHLSRCIRIIDLGTQTEEFEGNEKRVKKVQLSFELIGQTFTLNEGEEDEREVPFVVHKEYTASIGAKANLGKDIAAWLGKKIDPSDEFEIDQLLGKECQVQVITAATKKDGKEYSKINAILAIPAKTKVPKAESPLQSLYLEDGGFDQDTFDALPEFLQERIEDSPEYKALFAEEEKPKAAAGKSKKPATPVAAAKKVKK
jgi:hypothetical protein